MLTRFFRLSLGGLLLLLSTVWTFSSAGFITFGFLVSDRWGHWLHRLWGRGICRLWGIHVEVYYLHRLAEAGGVVLAPNHQSMFDIPILASLPIEFKWVAKKELKKLPLFGWGMSAMGSFFVSRRNSAEDLGVLREVEDGLKKGKRVVIFPEGTRTREGNLLPFKRGAFRAAQNAAVPLCPVAISGSFSIAPPGKPPLYRNHKVSLRFGPLLTSPIEENPANFIERYRKELVRLLEENTGS